MVYHFPNSDITSLFSQNFDNTSKINQPFKTIQETELIRRVQDLKYDPGMPPKINTSKEILFQHTQHHFSRRVVESPEYLDLMWNSETGSPTAYTNCKYHAIEEFEKWIHDQVTTQVHRQFRSSTMSENPTETQQKELIKAIDSLVRNCAGGFDPNEFIDPHYDPTDELDFIPPL